MNEDRKPKIATIAACVTVLFLGWHLMKIIGCDPLASRPKPSAYDNEVIKTELDPLQSPPLTDQAPIVVNKEGKTFSIQPVATYSISGRVVSTRRYYSGWDFGLAAELSPVDLAITWGKLANPLMDQFISYDHGLRFVHFHYKNNVPAPLQYINEHVSNNHLIAATETLEQAMKTVKKNELVTLEGYLVNVDSTQGRNHFFWKTSLTRTDTGGGACELIYVIQLKIGNAIYR